MRAIRRVSVRQAHRIERSRVEHSHIIDALRSRDADQAESLVRHHALGLAAHVEQYGVFPG
ncbi:FCD domain-containing protein [Methylobrevis pamukkalensis]|uniref:GntR C-terminal domain-containing protein n=1 Tax=Methylobrevis pamukkalensis TaxID=1439726 RepID=A0A1E3GXM0_9HYPH|nr:FCD domain-containing protein [Methylobrevis pamukkalensis]ODN68773.1 hypothetical protein A6302_03932 [Methylobrevis pamukkalensis]